MTWVTRFWAKSETADNGCWEWTASKNGGYGQFVVRTGERPQRAHRLAYELLVGPIPSGLELDHLCRNRSCINPIHLEPVSRRENLRRSPIVQSKINAQKTHCPHGHPYNEENTRLYRGGRFCRCCQAIARDRRRGKI